jgi:hypothetical protein
MTVLTAIFFDKLEDLKKTNTRQQAPSQTLQRVQVPIVGMLKKNQIDRWKIRVKQGLAHVYDFLTRVLAWKLLKLGNFAFLPHSKSLLLSSLREKEKKIKMEGCVYM